ncbi:probable 6-phosphogluconolactonase 2 [Phoenix dactylifera]|uniref:Probable 6-phosphogluconolactonase n=1 Tax=Phoenix dactylifera TaxID=42345 RepID=A0A8B7MS12_PHODC|nr:probable 6-phosphogluconolactonase 2 [Phoenix dactylifera]XP_017696120.2 probable 6-phosphogluconolactonase 2 [Phoenix dactylifera]XP_038982050.1 probable 6-phosphogluconolactonase 2 [Phoenix dactylifera]
MAASSNHPKMKRELRISDSVDELTTDLVEYIAQLSENSVKEKGRFTIALSGRSLIDLIGKLCEAPYIRTVDWRNWYFFWADERGVAKDHVDSNYKLTKDGFLSRVPVPSKHITSINDSISIGEAALRYEFDIRQLVKAHKIDVDVDADCPKFDLVLLEMGADGHVASLFPNKEALQEKTNWVVYLIDSPEHPPERITLTLPVINSAYNVLIVATGEDKADAVHQAVAVGEDGGDGFDVTSSPAHMVNPSDGKLVWFLDATAASKLCPRG